MTNLIISHNPAQEVGEYISKAIREHAGDFVCLLAGGSALDVIPHIDPYQHCYHEDCKVAAGTTSDIIQCQKSECRTIFIMGDEQRSREPNHNNYLKLSALYPNHPVTRRAIPTIPTEDETLKTFAQRIEETFLEILIELNSPKIITILDIDTDGHTGNIFPMEEVAFRATYQADQTYVPVTIDSLKIDSRASFTPYWILNNTDEIIGYAVGPKKHEILISLSTENKKLHERPAELINQHACATIYTDLDVSA